MRIAFLHLNTLENTPAPQLKDIRVRQAIMHAIDRESMVKQIVGEGARVLHTHCFPSQFGCTDEGAPRYAYDPAKAKQLLAEAGFPNGFDIDFYAYRERNQTEAMIGYLRAVGIKANLRFMQYAAMREAVRAGKAALIAPDLGFVLGQRRVGLDAGLLQVRRRRRHARSGSARSRCEQGDTSVSIRRCARRPTSKALDADRGAGLFAAAVFADDLLRRHQGPRLHRLSGRDAALLGDELEVRR